MSKIELPISELRRRILLSFIDRLSSAQDKPDKDTLKKLIEDYAEAIRQVGESAGRRLEKRSIKRSMQINQEEIPIIEPEKSGYWSIYPDHREWHNEKISFNKMKFQDYDKANEKYDMGGGNWVQLEEGDNKIRIVSEFEDFGSHYVRKQKKSYICVGKDKDCWFCERGLKPRVRYVGYVIDRKDGKVKWLEIGHQIFSQIGKYAKNPEYKFKGTPNYDITINRTGSGLDTEYTVIPARENKPLTKEEKKEIEEKMSQTTPEELIQNRKDELLARMKESGDQEGLGEDDEIDVDEIPY